MCRELQQQIEDAIASAMGLALAELDAAEALLALSQPVFFHTSHDKRQDKEHQVLQEKRDDQVKNMISTCMQTIKDTNTDRLLHGSSSSNILNAAGPSSAPDFMQTSETSSDTEAERGLNKLNNLTTEKATVKTAAQLKQLTNNIDRIETTIIEQNSNLPRKRAASRLPQNFIIVRPETNDQGTQTDICMADNMAIVPEETILLLKSKLDIAYARFLKLVRRMNIDLPDDSAYNSEGEESRGNDSERENVPEPTAEEMRDNLNNFNDGARNVQVRRVSAHTTNPTDNSHMVPLGSGRALVSSRLMNRINWDSHTSATRKLLRAVFPRKVLATHSLTGKQSPAFPEKPPKKSLDPELIEDIVETVSERCGVPKRLVRACITLKCSDEARFYQKHMQAQTMHHSDKQPEGQPSTSQENDENIAPSPVSRRFSNESSSLSD